MFSIKPPITEYKKLEDIGKFNMLWDVSVMLVPVFLGLLIMHILFGDSSWKTSLVSLAVCGINLAVLYRTRKYLLIAISSVVLATLVCQTSIFLVDARVIADAMWCILVGFFAFFLLGNLWGIIVLMTNITGLMVFILTVNDSEMVMGGLTNGEVDLKMVANVYYVAIALAFIVYKMINNTRDIQNRYEKEIGHNEILLKEIHHRVKNNLQIVSSLLKLQSAESSDNRVQKHFDEAIGRIRSMALIHERMYNDDDLSSVDIKSYLELLAKDIFHSNQVNGDIRFNVISDLEQVDIKSIVPISLIFNELITNSIKHGFRESKKGGIELRIERTNGFVRFHYCDDGDWREPNNSSSFGLDLIETLTGQLDGQLKRNIENGTHFYLDFEAERFFFSE
jgi:two-component sensor histidine kinase